MDTHMNDIEDELITEIQTIQDNHNDILIENITSTSSNQINVGDTFFSWELAEIRLNQYAKGCGFSLCRKCVEYDDERNVRQRTFECSFSGVAVSNKVINPTQQRKRPFRKTNCSWHINPTKPMVSAEVGVTSITGQHNHPLLHDVDLYIPKYRRLPDDIMEDIKFYITKGNMGAKQIYPLLVSKFSDQILLKQDLYNAIKKFRSPLNNHHSDAQNIVNQLLELKDKKDGWIIKTRLDPFDNCTSSLCTLHNQIQKQLDNEAQWAHHNNFLQSLPTNNILSVLEPVFSKVFDQMKRYLIPHILSIQLQQILGALLYRSKLVPKDSINIVSNGEEIDCNIGFLEDQLKRPQATLSYLLNGVRLIDIVEIWELRWYLESMQVQVDQLNLQEESVEIVTQFQQVNNTQFIVNDFHIFNQLRALNMALDLGCADKFVDMIDGFIARKKNSIEESNQENMNITDSLASSEGDCSKISNSALNLTDPNLYIQPQQLENTSVSRVPFQAINSHNIINKSTSITTTQVIDNNSIE
ncbi:20927_t:CDS:2, partial [Gigaspora rosea]